jgi:peptidoglycan/xylan/chitin deacetylase (PgdA/CDA1 family)
MIWKNGARAAITLCFDDGIGDVYKLTSKLLSSYGIRATYFIPTGYVGGTFYGSPSMSFSDLRECVHIGMEIGSHSVSHSEFSTNAASKFWRVLRNVAAEESKLEYVNYILGQTGRNVMLSGERKICPSNQVESEIALSKEILERELAPYRVSSFAYPRGSFTKRIEDIVRRSGYSSARSTVVGLNNPEEMNLFSLKCKVWRRYTNLDTMNHWVDRALETGTWLIELFHRVSDDLVSAHEMCQLSQLKAHLDYAVGKNVWIDTERNVVAYVSERGSANL